MKTLHILFGLTLVVALATAAGAQTAPPVLTPIGAQSINEGQTLSLHITATDADVTIPVLSTSVLPPNAVFVDSLNGAGSLTFSPDFTQAGPYSITFRAADAVTADTASEVVLITVNNVNLAPVLADPGPQSVNEGLTLNFGVTATDPDATIPTLSAINLPANATFADSLNGAGSVSFSPNFTQSGVYNISIIATDGSLADTQAVAITVNNVNRVPVLADPGPQSVNEGQTLNFGVTATDPDATIPTLSAINLPANATFTDSLNGAGSLSFSPNFTQSGVYNISIIATDGPVADTQAVAITVNNVNLSPVLADPGPQSVNEGQTLNFGVTATDPDATIPTLSAINLPANATFTDSLNGAGSVSFSPNFTQSGVYNISIIATDGSLADTQAVAITVNNVNLSPVLADPGPQSVNEGQTLNFGVTATDPDATIPTLSAINLPANATFADSLNGAGSVSFSPNFTQAGVYNISIIATDGTLADTQAVAITVNNVNLAPVLADPGPQSVNEGQTLNFGVTATDPDATIPTLSAINLPVNATFADSLNGAGSVSFGPDFTQSGVYNISIIATDGSLADTQAVAITVNNVNRVPVLADPGPQSVNEGQTLNFGVTATDPDATIPTLSAINLPVNATFADSLNGAGSVSFSPNFTQAGVYNISIIATDGTLADTQAVAITVNNVNLPPVLSNIGAQSVPEGLTLNLHVTATDADGTTPVLSALNLPANATFADSLNGAGRFTFTPDNTQSGIYNVSFIATDGTLADTLIVQITVTNQNLAPVVTVPGPQNVNEGQILAFRVSATDADATIPTLSAINLPLNATFTDSLNGAGSVSFSPNFTQAGAYNIIIIASDGFAADTGAVAITVNNVNLAPVLSNIGAQSVPEGLTLNLHVTATDADGTTPTLTAINVPVNATFADSLNGAGRFTFTPDNTQSGIYNVSFIATDGTLADTLVVQITVTNQNLVPVITVPGAQIVDEGQTLSFGFTSTDPDATIPVLTAFNLPNNAVITDSLNGAGSITFSPDFTQAGPYTVSIIASDGFAADTGTVAITVNNVNLAPVLVAVGPQLVAEGQTLNLRVSAIDADATIPALSAFNLPVNATFVDSLNGAGGFVFSPDFTQGSVYNVSFVATDGALADTIVVQVTVSNQNLTPVVTVPGPQSVNEGQAVSFGVSAVDADGTTPTLSALSLPANAVFTDSLNGFGSVTFSPDFTQSGVYNISIIASDGFSADTGTVSFTVNNVNLAPIVVVPGAQLVAEGQTLTFGITSSDPDATISVLSAFGVPVNATFTDSLNGAGAFTFSPDFTQGGIVNVSFVASDGTLADTGVVQITVSNLNLAPVVTVPGAQIVNEGQLLNFRVSAIDPDGGTPVLSAVNLPANAVFTDSLNGAGSVRFSPNFTQAGLYTVSIIASDGSLADTGSVAITVNDVNTAPTLATIGPRSVTEGQILTFRVSATDLEGATPVLSTSALPTNAIFADSLNGAGAFRFLPDFTQSGVYNVSFFASDGILVDTEIVAITVLNFGANAEPVITAVPDTTVAEGGVLTLTIQASDPDGGTAPELSVNTTLRNYTFLDHRNNTGTLTYSPGYTNAGLDTVRVFATDFGSPRMTATEVFSITTTDVNQAPTWAPRGPFSLSAGQTLSIVVAARDSTDPVTTNRLFLSVLDAPANATFTDSANGRGRYFFAPTAAQVGTDTVHFLAVDQGQPTMSAILSVIIIVRQQNRPPIVAPIGPKVVVEGQLLTITMSATDPDGGIPFLAADPLPAGAIFDDNLNGTGTFTWTPSFLQAGLYSISFKATDLSATGKEIVFIQVYEAGNQRPIFDSFPAISVIEADSVTKIITGSDPDGGTVTLSAIAATVPSFVTITISGRTATVKVKPNFGDDGPYTFDLAVSDGTLADTATFNLTVLDAGNQQAVLAPIGAKQVTELLSISFRVSATDGDQSKPILSASPIPVGAIFRDSLNGAGSFSWAPTDTDSGTYLVTFFAQDADSLAYIDSEQVTIVVKDTNRVPLIITSGARTMNEGAILNYSVSAIDPDGTIPLIRARLEGSTVDSLATNMTMFDSANGTAVLTFAPSYSQSGIYFVRFFARDAADTNLIKNATAPVQITVNNVVRPPAMVFSLGTGPFTISEGASLTFGVTASDPDGGSITNLTASPLPANATFGGPLPTRTFNFTPSFIQAGTYNVTFTATKTGGQTASQIVTVNVTEAGNQNPIFSTVLADTLNCPVNINTAINVKAVDPDGQAIVITGGPTVPNSLFIDSTNGAATYFYVPDNLDLGQVFLVTFIARDPLLAADTVTTVLRVTAFLRGDVDNNAKYTMNDLAFLIGYLFRQGPAPSNLEAADVDKDRGVNIGDISFLINFLYLNGPRPPQ